MSERFIDRYKSEIAVLMILSGLIIYVAVLIAGIKHVPLDQHDRQAEPLATPACANCH